MLSDSDTDNDNHNFNNEAMRNNYAISLAPTEYFDDNTNNNDVDNVESSIFNESRFQNRNHNVGH